jgi:hypothetical protein
MASFSTGALIIMVPSTRPQQAHDMFVGDDLSICSTAGAELWVWGMGEPLSTWKPWYSQGQVAGYSVEFPGMRFSAVHGAGHMVPSTRPQQAYDMFVKFLEDKPW